MIADLEALCTEPGYIHAVAALCFRYNMMLIGEHLTASDVQDRFNLSRLLRTEINTLLGLMLKTPIDWSVPSNERLSEYVEASDRLLQELHDALSSAFDLGEMFGALERGETHNPFDSGEVMREPIFYAAESAYNFQYLDLGKV
ncbi:hypothetical protein [Xanthomonas sp. 3075]|uniref:hypothetical protein n=1 Tax=Xanthomonas sp. 3075 TaxID=3035315 RepID=UPI0016230771|nr:hypothetical protein [Xanthomonas sp. 3075]MBB4133366.1 hypothetical protein [Xanthomonas sp. 3075]